MYMPITDADVTKLKKTFATKDDLKRFATKDELGQRIRHELEAQKPEWVCEITDAVVHALGDKIDKMYVKLDKFIGEIQTRRTEDKLHTKDHDRVHKRLDRVEKHAGLPPYVD